MSSTLTIGTIRADVRITPIYAVELPETLVLIQLPRISLLIRGAPPIVAAGFHPLILKDAIILSPP